MGFLFGTNTSLRIKHHRLSTQRAVVSVRRPEPHIQAVLVEPAHALRTAAIRQSVRGRVQRAVADRTGLHVLQLRHDRLRHHHDAPHQGSITHDALAQKQLPLPRLRVTQEMHLIMHRLHSTQRYNSTTAMFNGNMSEMAIVILISVTPLINVK